MRWDGRMTRRTLFGGLGAVSLIGALRALAAGQPRETRAIYCSVAPLFGIDSGEQPIEAATYSGDGGRIAFRRYERHYLVSGDAAPETVALIPLVAQPGLYLFQQSAGSSATFYGILSLASDARSFLLFSPESAPDAARRAALTLGATASASGFVFAEADSLLDALLLISHPIRPANWTAYTRVEN